MARQFFFVIVSNSTGILYASQTSEEGEEKENEKAPSIVDVLFVAFSSDGLQVHVGCLVLTKILSQCACKCIQFHNTVFPFNF